MNEEEKTLVEANEPLVTEKEVDNNDKATKSTAGAPSVPVKVPGGVTVQGEDDEDDADDGEERLLVADPPEP